MKEWIKDHLDDIVIIAISIPVGYWIAKVSVEAGFKAGGCC